MTSSTSAAADLEELRRFALDLEDRHLHGKRANIDDAFKWNQVVRIIGKLAALEAQQTDTLSRNNDGIPDIIAHGIMEEVRMQTTQVSTPDEPNYSSDPYYDAECKISEIIAKHRAAIDTLSELRTQIEEIYTPDADFKDQVLELLGEKKGCIWEPLEGVGKLWCVIHDTDHGAG